MKGLTTVLMLALATAMVTAVVSCSGPNQAAAGSWLAGVRTDDLTSTERADLDRYLHSFPSPCASVSASVAQCLQDKLACKACEPAAAFVAAAIRSGRSGAQVEAAYMARFDPSLVKTIDISGAPTMGPPNAPVTIVEFADFQCPTCALSVEILDRVVKSYAPNVRLVFKHFPLQYHQQADLAARAAVAAMRQNKFWEMHHVLFRNRTALQPEEIDRYAAGLGLDMARFKADLASPEVRKIVDRDREQGDELRLRGTPSVFINGREFSFDLFDFGGDDLLNWIELEIELATGQKVARPAAAAAPAPAAPAGSADGEGK